MRHPVTDGARARIDVHMLTLDEPLEWRAQCLQSVVAAPIRLHVLPGIPGRIGQARAAGYACGNLPLVSYIDPDDIYDVRAFSRLADELEARPDAVLAYTDEALVDAAGRKTAVIRGAYNARIHAMRPRHVHGLIVMRRDALQNVLPHIVDLYAGADWRTTLLLAQRGAVVHLPIIGRCWRQHPGQHHRSARYDARQIAGLAISASMVGRQP